MSLQTVLDVLQAAVDRKLPVQALHRVNGVWTPISSAELYRAVAGTSRALAQWGVQKGDRVAILAENRPEWAIADFAILSLGAVVVPIYATLTAEQTAYILKDSGARTIFLSSADQLKKFQTIKHQTNVERVVIMDEVAPSPDLIPMRTLVSGEPEGPDPQFDARCQAVRGEDLATIIYTSGTTGTPKGVMLTHYNLVSNVYCSVTLFYWHPGEVGISFLPLSHITARHLDYAFYFHGVTLVYCPFFEQLPEVMTQQPSTIFTAVPRVYEKVRATVETKIGTGWKRKLYDWALKVGAEHREQILRGEKPSSLSWKIADKAIYSKIKAAFGGKVHYFISGGAPLGIDLARWYADVGIRIHEGYGLTETSPVIAVNNPQFHRIGTVGRPLPNLECKIAEDGELLVKGPSVFTGYWNLPEETRNAFIDGWFKTGDIGHIDADGYLSIIDRKKDLIKTSGGKFISPQPIETALRGNALVAHASVIGDRRKFASVVIAPHFPLLEDWAHVNAVPFSNRQELVSHPRVRALFDGIVGEVNQRLARFETLKKVILVPDEFSIATGELTPSMKLKRRVIEQKYKAEIDAAYAEAEHEHEAVNIV